MLPRGHPGLEPARPGFEAKTSVENGSSSSALQGGAPGPDLLPEPFLCVRPSEPPSNPLVLSPVGRWGDRLSSQILAQLPWTSYTAGTQQRENLTLGVLTPGLRASALTQNSP